MQSSPLAEVAATVYRRAEGRCECAKATCSHHRGRCCARLHDNDWQLANFGESNKPVLANSIAVCARCAMEAPPN
jgi:hypothetical protein